MADLIARGIAKKGLTDLVFNVKSYGAKGDYHATNNPISDDTKAFEDCYADAVAQGRGVVYIPRGTYRLTRTINHRSWITTLGAGKFATTLIVDHDGAGYDFVVGDDSGVPLQGGDVTFEKLTIKRKAKPVAKIAGNYALRIHGTFGHSLFSDIVIRDMGDSAILINDDTKYRGTSPMSFRDVMAKTNLYGYGLEVLGCFADIYTDGFHSWGNAGGFNFDGSSRDTTKANYYPYQVVIRNSDSEFAGGYITTPGSTTPTAPVCYPVVRARYIRGLVIDGCTLITTKNSGQHAVDLDYCENVEIDGGTSITSDGGSTSDAIYLGQGCEHIRIGNINLYGSEHSRYGINSQGVKGLFISNPKISGFSYGGDLNLKALYNAVATLKITAAATTAGNISITIGGVQRTIVLAAGDNIATVMSKISSTTFTGFTLSDNGIDTVTFTATATGYKDRLTLNPGSTGTAGSVTVINTGLRKTFVESEERSGYVSNDYTGAIEDTQGNYGSKAWGTFKWDSAGSYVTVQDGQNVASVSRTGTGKFLVTFKIPFANNTYGVTANGKKAGGSSIQYENRTTTSVELWGYDNAGALVDWDLISFDINAR